MGIFRRGKSKEQQEDEEYQKASANTEQSRPADTERYIEALQADYHLIKDDQVTTLLWRKPKFRNLIPASSGLNRSGNIDKKEARIQKLKYKLLLLKQKGYMNTREYAKGGSAFISSLDIHFRNIPNDSVNGWKGKLMKEKSTVVRTVLQKEKKRRSIM